jgi:hypothetical protein
VALEGESRLRSEYAAKAIQSNMGTQKHPDVHGDTTMPRSGWRQFIHLSLHQFHAPTIGWEAEQFLRSK